MRLLTALLIAVLGLGLVACSSGCNTSRTKVHYEPMSGPPTDLGPGDISFTAVESSWCGGTTFVGHTASGCTGN